MEPTISELILSGVKLMLIGMGIVYLFLALLVWVIGLTARLIQRFSSESPTRPLHPTPAEPSTDAAEQGELIAVISAAIHHHQTN